MRLPNFTSAAGPLAASLLLAFSAHAAPPHQQRPTASMGAAPTLETREIRAQLAPRRYTTLAAEIGAKVNDLPVSESGTFKAGQVLIRFDCSMQQAQHAKARASLGAAEKAWQVNQRLVELHSIGRLELDVSEAEVQKARADVTAHQVLLSKCSVVAPFSGRIAEQKVREQQFVQPGQPLLELIDDSTLELEFIVPSRWLAWVRPKQAFQVAIDETGRSYPARVTRIAARVDPVSQSVKLTGVIDGRFSELIAGMSGRVVMSAPLAAQPAAKPPPASPYPAAAPAAAIH